MKDRRGFTIVEAMVALAVLAIGTTGVLALLTNVSEANRRRSFQTGALATFEHFAAQVHGASCDLSPGAAGPVAPGADPAFLTGLGTWQVAPIAGSQITLVGNQLQLKPALNIMFMVTLSPWSIAPIPPPPPVGPPQPFNVDVRICEISDNINRPCANPPRQGYWVREFMVKKDCNQRLEILGRGEYYN